MAVLVVAVRPDGERTGVADLADVLIVRELGSETWARLAVDLRVGKVIGAAVTSESRSDAWQLVHAAHRGLLVDSAEEEIVSALIHHGWMRIASHKQQVVLVPPAESSPNRSVASEEFGQLIEGDEPVSTLVDPHEVSLDDEQLFGVFASHRLGGSSALLAMSGADVASCRMEDRRLELRNPAALGLERVDRDPWSIVTPPVRCVVLGLASRDDAPSWTLFAEPDAVSQLWETRDRNRADFWLMIELTASEVDPPVWMPAGQIFEQKSFTGRQTLATTAAAGTLVTPGRRSTLLLPAFCLDRHLGSPASDPMRVTPLRSPLPRGATQDRVWWQRIVARGGQA
ncbi:hypothetical protein ACFY0G_30805 [Streptomyces sp. NPDC001552]|uniref:hypothetical protein n=1 Tax=Streptomyces sp. NPDC001552 TaxID=3364587 RepID=UPI00367B7647